MPISDAVCRTSKSREKPYKLSDGGGLYLLVETNGSKLWRQAFRFDGKQKLIALGGYPAVSLAEARAGRDANKSLLARGVDPSRSAEDRPRCLRAKTNGNTLFNFGLADKRIYHCGARFGCSVQNAGGTRSMPMLLTGPQRRPLPKSMNSNVANVRCHVCKGPTRDGVFGPRL